MNVNGIMLVSTGLNFQTIRFAEGNDLPYVLYLPSYTATAWYHKRLPADLQARQRLISLAHRVIVIKRWDLEIDYKWRFEAIFVGMRDLPVGGESPPTRV